MLAARMRVVFAALEVDLVLKGPDEFFNKLWRHQALAQSVDDQSLKSSPADALTIGTVTAATGCGACEIVAPD